MVIKKQDTDGTKPLLDKGELGYDAYPAGGDEGRVYAGTGTENIPQAREDEVVKINSDQALAAGDAIDITGQTLTISKGDGSTETATIPTSSAPVATETVSGTVELATLAETATGTDTERAVTPQGLKQEIDSVNTVIEGISTLSMVASSALLDGTVSISTTNINVTDGAYVYTDGRKADGSFNLVSVVDSGLTAFSTAAVPDGTYWIARDLLGNLVTFDKRPSVSPIGGAVWFNTKDGKWYQNNTPLANPISFISQYPYEITSGVPVSLEPSQVAIPGVYFESENRYVQNIGNVSINDELIFTNLFGNSNYEDCTVEIMAKVNGEWGVPGWTYIYSGGSYRYGVKANVMNRGIVVRAGSSSVTGTNENNGSGFSSPAALTTAECKIIVTKHSKVKEIV